VETAIGGIARVVLRLVGRLLPANLRRAADLIVTRPAATPTGTVAVDVTLDTHRNYYNVIHAQAGDVGLDFYIQGK